MLCSFILFYLFVFYASLSHYELLEAFMLPNIPVANVLPPCPWPPLCCCCCCACCCCACCCVLACRPCFGTGGCRYSCLANVNTSIRSSFLYARQLLMKLCAMQKNNSYYNQENEKELLLSFYLCFVADGRFIGKLNLCRFQYCVLLEDRRLRLIVSKWLLL